MDDSQGYKGLETQTVIDTFYDSLYQTLAHLNEVAKPAHEAMVQFMANAAKVSTPVHDALVKAIPRLHAQLIVHTFGGVHGQQMSRSLNAYQRRSYR